MRTLVLGYGNDLRRDDAAGRRVADAIAERGLPGVDARSLHQLTPELAADLAEFDAVVFVDADVTAGEAHVHRIEPRPVKGAVTTHHVNPVGLLDLAGLLGEGVPDAYVVSVPVRDLTLGEELTDVAAEGVRVAIEQVADLCTPDRSDPASTSRP